MDYLDYDTFDERIKTAFDDAKKAGLTFEFIPETEDTEHPNTARLVIGDDEQRNVDGRDFYWWRKNGNYRIKWISTYAFW